MEAPPVDLVALVAALGHRPVTVVRDGASYVVATEPDELVVANGAAAFAAFDLAARDGYWAGFATYDLGRAVEPVVARTADDLHVSDVVLARHDARIVWSPGRAPRVIGHGPARRVLEAALSRAETGAGRRDLPPLAARSGWRSSLTRAEHAARVERVHSHLLAGDCYQVNLTRRLTLDEHVDPRSLFAAVHEHHFAPHAALLAFGAPEVPVDVVSASPELFLRTRGRAVETRPIKGTARDAVQLRGSEKDRAENVMIVDLARNDLGRVCAPGSITVPDLLAVEPHPGLHHLVSTVRGRLRPDVTLGGLMRATMPPASVTGAPKPRVMQVIEDLEPVRRGVYCGAVGWIDAAREASEWSVAIRTFQVAADQVHFGVGGGIVADSRAEAEWAETELKAHRLLALVPTVARATGRPAPAGSVR